MRFSRHQLIRETLLASEDGGGIEFIPESVAAPAQPEQKPHSWYSAEHNEWMPDKTRKEHERLNSYTHKVGGFDLPLYTTPPAAPVQEPEKVGRITDNIKGMVLRQEVMLYTDEYLPIGTPLYTSPPQREWVGLTPHERMMCRSYDVDETIAKTEDKLKEKNT